MILFYCLDDTFNPVIMLRVSTWTCPCLTRRGKTNKRVEGFWWTSGTRTEKTRRTSDDWTWTWTCEWSRYQGELHLPPHGRQRPHCPLHPCPRSNPISTKIPSTIPTTLGPTRTSTTQMLLYFSNQIMVHRILDPTNSPIIRIIIFTITSTNDIRKQWKITVDGSNDLIFGNILF